MAGNMFAAVVLVASFACALAQQMDCSPYGDPSANTCDTHDKNTATYRDLHAQLRDASGQEHLGEFVMNITLGMYTYLHPCQSIAEAALRLFYGHTTVPDHNSNWWHDMATVISAHGGPLVGRRKRAEAHYADETDLLRSQLNKIREETHSQVLTHSNHYSAECIQALIDEFKDLASRTFKAKYPSFTEPPVTHATHPTTPQPTTPQPTTHQPTTHQPTTHTTRPTTTTPKPTTTTTTTTTTHAPTTTTKAPVAANCTTCSMLECLLSPKFGVCADSAHEFCVTEVVDQQAGRRINRHCATRQECDSWVNHPNCTDIETHVLDNGVTCRYCCSGPICNHPPQLLPAAITLYTPHP